VRGIRRRAIALLMLAIAGLTVLAVHHPSAGAGPELDADTVAAAGWAAWLVAGYLLLALGVASAQCLYGVRGARRHLPLASAVSRMAERWIGLTAAGLAAAALTATATPALAAEPSPQPVPTVAAPVPSLDWTQPASTPVATTAPTRLRRPLLVQPGDCLWSIAAHELGDSARPADIARRWPLWWSTNRAVIGARPDLIRPGQRLNPPASPLWRS
jgi:hypothetical protein